MTEFFVANDGTPLVEQFLLCGHPAWPDPLLLNPPTLDHGRRLLAEHPHPDAHIRRRLISAAKPVDLEGRGG